MRAWLEPRSEDETFVDITSYQDGQEITSTAFPFRPLPWSIELDDQLG